MPLGGLPFPQSTGGAIFRKAKTLETNVSREVAEAEFERFAEAARLDLGKPRNENDRRSVADDRELFVYQVMRGRISVDEDGWPTVHTDSEALPVVRFSSRPRVTNYRAMDKVKATNEIGKMLAMIADVTGVPTALLNGLEQADFENVSLTFGLFLV